MGYSALRRPCMSSIPWAFSPPHCVPSGAAAVASQWLSMAACISCNTLSKSKSTSHRAQGNSVMPCTPRAAPTMGHSAQDSAPSSFTLKTGASAGRCHRHFTAHAAVGCVCAGSTLPPASSAAARAVPQTVRSKQWHFAHAVEGGGGAAQPPHHLAHHFC